jgi:DNA-binding transcriptional regulator YiaG
MVRTLSYYLLCLSIRYTTRHPVVAATRRKARVVVHRPDRILRMRERAGLTQKEFAALVGVSKKTLEKWAQAGVSRPDLQQCCWQWSSVSQEW